MSLKVDPNQYHIYRRNDIQAQMEVKVQDLAPPSSHPEIIENIENIINDIVFAVIGNTDPLTMTTDIHDAVESRGEFRIYERYRCVFSFLISNYTNSDISFSYIFSFQHYLSMTSHSVHFAFSGIKFLYLKLSCRIFRQCLC